jgi:hypothetical protein
MAADLVVTCTLVAVADMRTLARDSASAAGERRSMEVTNIVEEAKAIWAKVELARALG